MCGRKRCGAWTAFGCRMTVVGAGRDRFRPWFPAMGSLLHLLYALAFGQAPSYGQYDWESPQRAPKPDRSRFSRSMTVVPILSSGENRSKSYSSISRSFSRGMVQLSSNILVGWRWRPQRPRPCYLHASPLASLPLGPCPSPWFGPVTVENRAWTAVVC